MTTQTKTSHAVPFLVGFGVLYVVLAGLAALNASGGYGVAILAAVLLAAALLERLDGRAVTVRSLGLGKPAAGAVLVALGVALLLQCVYPVVAAVTGADLRLKAGWPWLLVGLIAFHGLAEELVWRGYAFRRLRRGRSFGAAVLLTMPLIAATHLPVFVTSGVAVGLSAVLVAAVTSLPLAHLFELGRNTLWAPAVVHAGIDSFKLVDVPDDVRLTFSLTLAALSLTVPLLALLVRRRS